MALISVGNGVGKSLAKHADLAVFFRPAMILSAIGLASAVHDVAHAAEPPLPWSVAMRDTLDVWDNANGGLRTGAVLLNKLQVSGTFDGDGVGLHGLTVHAQVFRTDGSSLSGRLGDIQTADSIDARPVTRLFESWIEKKIGNDDRSVAVRLGLIDLNSDFDSVQTASLFVNSSHGIGPDLSHSGLGGPSVYPVSSLAFRVSWLPSKSWTLRLGIFDGVPGDPKRPTAFASVRLGRGDGALLIGQADYHLSDKAKIEAGAWRYTTALPTLTPTMKRGRADQGIYVSIEGNVPHFDKVSGWIRLGEASRAVQQIDRYIGAGLVGQGIFAARPEDRAGIAVARAVNGSAFRHVFGLRSAETSIEATYQYKVGNSFALQPDLQYIVHPSADAHIRNATVFGVRFVLTSGYPRKAPAMEAADPTVPPDGAQPNDQGPKDGDAVPRVENR